MFDVVRELVSNGANRFIDEKLGLNLDLTYITPRIIAMAFPAQNFIEEMYRNRAKDVQKLLTTSHKGKYHVFNLSNRMYRTDLMNPLFEGRVTRTDWEDHHPCPFNKFAQLLCEAMDFLLKDPDNVVVVHCVAGKGRTGSFIVALLMFSGVFTTVEKAKDFYFKKRKLEVKNPSQIRYLEYFHKFLFDTNLILNSDPRKLRYLVFQNEISKKYDPEKGGEVFLRVQDYTTGNFVDYKTIKPTKMALSDKSLSNSPFLCPVVDKVPDEMRLANLQEMKPPHLKDQKKQGDYPDPSIIYFIPKFPVPPGDIRFFIAEPDHTGNPTKEVLHINLNLFFHTEKDLFLYYEQVDLTKGKVPMGTQVQIGMKQIEITTDCTSDIDISTQDYKEKSNELSYWHKQVHKIRDFLSKNMRGLDFLALKEVEVRPEIQEGHATAPPRGNEILKEQNSVPKPTLQTAPIQPPRQNPVDQQVPKPAPAPPRK